MGKQQRQKDCRIWSSEEEGLFYMPDLVGLLFHVVLRSFVDDFMFLLFTLVWPVAGRLYKCTRALSKNPRHVFLAGPFGHDDNYQQQIEDVKRLNSVFADIMAEQVKFKLNPDYNVLRNAAK